MPDIRLNRRKQFVASAPGTGTATLAGAAPGFLALGAGQDGQTVRVLWRDGLAWEICGGCTYTHSGTTLTRGTLEESSSGSRINLSASATMSVIFSAADGSAWDSAAGIPLSQKGAADGVATLDSSGKIPGIQLPSFVDDIIEGATLAAFPATGEQGKIYVALNTGRTYRWSGSAYVEIVASPGTTDAIVEGSANLYFTEGRVRSAALSGVETTISDSAIVNGDSVLTGIRKLIARILAYSTIVRTWTAAQRGTIVTLTDGATVTPDFNNQLFTWTIAGTGRTLANPTNLVAGQSGSIYIVQDATGSRTITSWGSAWDFEGGTLPTLSTAANAVDCLVYQVRTTGSIHCYLAKDIK